MRLELLCNLFIAGYFGYFAWHSASTFGQFSSLPVLLILIKQLLDLAFTVVRRFPKHITTNGCDWLIAASGTLLPVLFRPAICSSYAVAAISLIIIGLSLQILSLMSLGRSTGIVAANRGVRTIGMYRFVRHPLYSSYCIAYFGIMLSMFCAVNLTIFALLVLLLVMRIRTEEKILLQDSAYQKYHHEVPWRLMPGLF